MSDDDFPFRSFTVRAEGYDRGEVDAYVAQLQGEISELRRAVESPSAAPAVDARLHDPEGAVTRTLAIAQETADRVLHDAQVEADRRRSEADEQASSTVADAESRAAKMMADIETQTAEVRAQGIAAARAAIQVERDKAVAELGQIRRVRDDIRSEAVELKSVLDRYSRQALEASEVLSAASSGPLLSFDLPDFVAADVALAGVVDEDEFAADPPTLSAVDTSPADAVPAYEADDDDDEPTWAEAPAASPEPDLSWLDDGDDSDGADASDDEPESGFADDAAPIWSDDDPEGEPAASMADGDDDGDAGEDDDWFSSDVAEIDDDEPLAEVIALDPELPSDLDAASDASSGAFLAEVRAAADDPVALPAESEESVASDRFLSELRGVTDAPNIEDGDIDDDAADRFFDSD